MKKKRLVAPKGGKGKRANYKSITIRVPLPLEGQVRKLIEEFHEQNAEYLSMPVAGDWWEILQVSPKASAEDVREAYRRLVSQVHPDRNWHPDAKERFIAVNEAYKAFQNQQA